MAGGGGDECGGGGGEDSGFTIVNGTPHQSF